MVDALEGKVVGGRYRVGQLLGVGGSASIFEAEDLTFGRRVALKMPHDNVGPNSLAAKRLVREARASAAVSHPNVCEVSEIGTLPNGSPFVVMERLVGETLRDRITNEGKLPFGDVVDIMMQVLSGLSEAHERGIIHRDVKPENIFLSRRAGCAALVKILDFGLVATDERAKEELTAAGMVVGTPYYIAPEQIRGVRDFDPRVDLYACGVVLYEMTAGRRPFTGATTAELFKSILTGVTHPVTELRRETPPQLGGVIERAMSLAPKARFPTAASFQEALAQARVESPTTASLAPFRAMDPFRAPSEPRVRAASPAPLEMTRNERAASQAVETLPRPAPERDEWTQETEVNPPTTTEWDQPTVKNPALGPLGPRKR